MSVKKKLYSGFGLIIILIIVLGSIGIVSLNTASGGFKEYRQMAKNGVLIGRVQANMLMVRMNAKDYFIQGLQKDVDEFNNYYEKVQGFIQTAKKEINDPKRAKMVMQIDEKLKQYNEGFSKIQNLMAQRDEIVNNKMNIVGKEAEKLFTQLMNSAYENGDSIASHEAGLGLRNLLLSRLYAAKYLKTNASDDANRVRKEFKDLEYELELLKKQINDGNRKALLSQIIEDINEYEKAFNSVVEIITKRNDIINNTMNKIGPEVAKLTEDVKLDLKRVQDTIGPQVQESNETSMVLTSVISIFVIILAIVLAIMIPRGIINALEKVSLGLESFFRFLNKESKTVDNIALDTNDEFGTMAKVVNKNISSIENSFKQDERLINEVKQVVNQIDKGDISNSIKGTTVNQSLEELKTIFNNMLNTFRQKVATDLTKVTQVLEECSSRNFTSKIDDNGEFAVKINGLIDIINKMLAENMKNGIILDDSSDTLLTNVDLLNKNSTEAAAALEQTAAALEEVTSNVSSTTQNVVQMANHAKEVVSATETGEKLANDTTKAMDEINNEVTAISEAITVIDQIAFQTNILSLNAAVEAATAGEAGKGFAVVAQEVRNLASRSAEAAKEIKDLVENATTKANDGKHIADEMINGYNGLNTSISKTIELIQDVELASKEQQTGIVQINDAINSLDKQTQENANIASQTKDVAIKTDEISKTVVNNASSSNFLGKEQLLSSRSKTINKVKPTVESKPVASKNKIEKKVVKPTKTIEAKISNDDEWESF